MGNRYTQLTASPSSGAREDGPPAAYILTNAIAPDAPVQPAAQTADASKQDSTQSDAPLDKWSALRSFPVDERHLDRNRIIHDEDTLLDVETAAGTPSAESQESGGQAQGAESFRPGLVLAERFRIVRWLASGGMGEVYEAVDLELGGPVAVKTLRPKIFSDAE